MSGYTPDEKLRYEQLIRLRRQWLKDQELSPREPVVQARPPGAVAKFWEDFLKPKSLWRIYVSIANANASMLPQQAAASQHCSYYQNIRKKKGIYSRAAPVVCLATAKLQGLTLTHLTYIRHFSIYYYAK